MFDLEEQKLSLIVAQAATTQSGAWDGMLAGCNAFLDACLDPAVQRIVLLDAPSVLGFEEGRDIDASYFLQGIKAGLTAAIAAGEIGAQPLDAAGH